MGDIETSATAAIKIRLADTDLLSQYINERDKEPIWDGFIYAYKNKYKKNDDLIDEFLSNIPENNDKQCLNCGTNGNIGKGIPKEIDTVIESVNTTSNDKRNSVKRQRKVKSGKDKGV